MIEITQEIKQEHPELNPPEARFMDEQVSYWYHISFYYSDTKEIVNTWIRPDYEDSSITTFAFVGLSSFIANPTIKGNPIIDSLQIKFRLDIAPAIDNTGDFRGINHDFGYFANKKQLWKFDNNILELIEQKIKQRQENGT